MSTSFILLRSHAWTGWDNHANTWGSGFTLQEELSDTGHPRLTTQLYLISINPHPQLATPLADLPDLQLRNALLRRPVRAHRTVGGTADVVLIDARRGSEHPSDVILWEPPAG